MIISASQVVSELSALGIRQIKQPRDRKIFCPSDKWLDKFCEYLRQVLPIGSYEEDKLDCDDFALEVVVEAGRALRETKHLEKCSHSIGLCEMIISPFGGGFLGLEVDTFDKAGHLTNLIRTKTGWRFLEGQTLKHEKAIDVIDSGTISVCTWCWV